MKGKKKNTDTGEKENERFSDLTFDELERKFFGPENPLRPPTEFYVAVSIIFLFFACVMALIAKEYVVSLIAAGLLSLLVKACISRRE